MPARPVVKLTTYVGLGVGLGVGAAVGMATHADWAAFPRVFDIDDDQVKLVVHGIEPYGGSASKRPRAA